MFFRQLQCEGETSCAYLVGDLSTRVAVVIDPFRSVADRLASLLRQHDLALVAILETGLRPAPDVPSDSRFARMVELLGVSLGQAGSQEEVSTPWQDLPRGGPVDPWWTVPSSGSASVLFAFEGVVRELSPDATEVFSPTGASFNLRYRSWALSVGSVALRVLPVGDRPDAVAFYADSRLIMGGVLWSDPTAPAGPRTGRALFDLPGNTWVYPRRAGELAHATLAEERAAMEQHDKGRRGRPTVDERGFLPVVAGGELRPAGDVRFGVPNVQGYRDVVPAEVLLHLSHFDRVVMIGDPALETVTLPGAEVRTHEDVVRLGSEWPDGTRVLLLSEVGDRCGTTARALVHNGLSGVHRLIGGLALWESCGLPTETQSPNRRRA